jgi:hypothetical protein
MGTALACKVTTGNRLIWVLALVFVTFSGYDAVGSEWPIGLFQYEVRRGGEQIGVHTITATQDGERFVVEVTEWIEVNGWYGRYCHRAKRREVWYEGKLLRYDGATVGFCSGLIWGWDQVRTRKSCIWGDNREPIRFTAQQKEGRLVIARHNLSAGALSTDAPDTTLSANFMNPLIRQEQQARLLDPITGEPRALKIIGVGEEFFSLHGQTVETQKYQYTYLDDSKDMHHAWYTREGVMVRLENVRDEVIFTLIPVSRSHDQLSPPPTNEACSQDFPPIVDIQGTVP